MRLKYFTFYTAFLVAVALTKLHAQDVIPASAGNASGSGGSVNYTIGQVFHISVKDPNGSVNQGVQQPYEITVISGIFENSNNKLLISVFPNPSTDILTLKIENVDLKDLSCQLFDSKGTLLLSDKITDNKSNINLFGLTSGIYLLKVYDRRNTIKTFQIIKK